MKNEKLRADIKRELNRPTSMKKLAELLNRCYVALGEQQSVPEGWQIERTGNGDIIVRAEGVGGAVVSAEGTALRQIPEVILYHLAETLLAAAPSAPSVTATAQGDGWIPVGELLPEYGQEVIVNTDFEGVCAGVLDSYGEWFAPCSEYKLTRITHWMPLPAAPGAAPSAPKADDPVKQMLLEALEKVDSEHEILGWMKTCELRRGRGSFGIAIMSDELALDWQAHQKNLERLIGLRHAAIAAAHQPPVQDSCVRCGKETVCGKTHCEACCYEPISAPQPSDIEIAKLISCVRYLTGIAERGLKRQIREDESVESFVLGYVQSLDTLRQQLAEANDDTSRWHEIACKQSKRADGLADQRDKLAGLLREVGDWIDRTSFHGTDAVDLMQRIDAALAEVSK